MNCTSNIFQPLSTENGTATDDNMTATQVLTLPRNTYSQLVSTYSSPHHRLATPNDNQRSGSWDEHLSANNGTRSSNAKANHLLPTDAYNGKRRGRFMHDSVNNADLSQERESML